MLYATVQKHVLMRHLTPGTELRAESTSVHKLGIDI